MVEWCRNKLQNIEETERAKALLLEKRKLAASYAPGPLPCRQLRLRTHANRVRLRPRLAADDRERRVFDPNETLTGSEVSTWQGGPASVTRDALGLLGC